MSDVATSVSGQARPSRLAYVVLGSPKIDAWRSFAKDVMAMDVRETEGGGLALRMDAKPFRFAVEPSAHEGAVTAGWEFDAAADLSAVVDKLRVAGVALVEGDMAACQARGVERLYAFADPAGNPVELCFGHRDGDAPHFPRPLGGFKTGDCGLGHMVYACIDSAPSVTFYEDILGFRLSDSADEPFAATFMHVNPRHHSLALVEAGRTGVHHVMVELYAFDDVGQAYDWAQLEEGRVAVTLGRHTNDFMTSFYAATPSGFMIEYGWGGRTIDPEHWRAEVLHDGPSLWGHERQWLQGPKRQLARDMRLRAAEAGLKAPMQVSEGFFDIAGRADAPVRPKAVE